MLVIMWHSDSVFRDVLLTTFHLWGIYRTPIHTLMETIIQFEPFDTKNRKLMLNILDFFVILQS